MKFALITLIALTFCGFSYAGLAEKHQSFCKSSEAKNLMGDKGSCQIVISLVEAAKKSGFCLGNVKEEKCQFSFDMGKPEKNLILLCGDLKKPSLSQQLDAEAISYKVTALITKSSGKKTILTDTRDYTYIKSPLITISFEVSPNALPVSSIRFDLVSTSIDVENVLCL